MIGAGYFAFLLLLAGSAAFLGRLSLPFSGKNCNQARHSNDGGDYRTERLAFQDTEEDETKGDDGKGKSKRLPAPAFLQGVLYDLFFIFPAVFGFLFSHCEDAVCRSRERLLIITEFFGGRQWADVH
jgi:hypothetical protein